MTTAPSYDGAGTLTVPVSGTATIDLDLDALPEWPETLTDREASFEMTDGKVQTTVSFVYADGEFTGTRTITVSSFRGELDDEISNDDDIDYDDVEALAEWAYAMHERLEQLVHDTVTDLVMNSNLAEHILGVATSVA